MTDTPKQIGLHQTLAIVRSLFQGICGIYDVCGRDRVLIYSHKKLRNKTVDAIGTAAGQFRVEIFDDQ